MRKDMGIFGRKAWVRNEKELAGLDCEIFPRFLWHI
jgi:hypothetical protein